MLASGFLSFSLLVCVCLAVNADSKAILAIISLKACHPLSLSQGVFLGDGICMYVPVECVCVWATHRADSKWDSCKWRRCWPPPFPLLGLRMPSYVSGISLKNPLAWHSRQITKVPGAGDNHSSGLSNVGACLQNNTNKIKDPCDTLEVNLIFFLKSLSSLRSAIGFSWDIGVILSQYFVRL